MNCARIVTFCSLFFAFTELVNAYNCGFTYHRQRKLRIPKPDGAGRIVGGIEAVPHSFPWIVSLQTADGHFCGGTLIRVSNKNQSDIVVTAAHCVVGGVADLIIVAGAHDLYSSDGEEQEVKAAKTVYHSNYSSATMVNDIAVVLLDTPVNFTSSVQPACLPPVDQMVSDKSHGMVAGWGLTHENNFVGASRLMQVAVPTVAASTCQDNYRKGDEPMEIMPKNMLCAGYAVGGKDACQGDSGGPLTHVNNGRYYLQGVVSFGEGCARAGKPGIYTRVPTYIPWINSQINALSKVARS